MKRIIRLYTDGACSGNPGIGGWSCVNYDAENNTIWDAYTGQDDWDKPETTNNRMELKGLLCESNSITDIFCLSKVNKEFILSKSSYFFII